MALGILLVLLLLVVRTLYFAGSFKRIEPTGGAEGIRITNIVGAEDIAVDYSTGLAIVSSDDRRSTKAGKPIKGALYLIDLNKGGAVVRNLTDTYSNSDFHPHGISLFNDTSDSTQWLFAVNHRAEKECVEIFQFRDSTLLHSQTISSSLFFHPNDIAATGKNTFYFTNDHDKPGGISSW